MRDEYKTKKQLIKELLEMRRRISELEKLEIERKPSEDILFESEERLRQMAEVIPTIFLMTTPDWKNVIYVSPAFEKIYGHTCDSLYQQPKLWLDVIHKEDREWVLSFYEKHHAEKTELEYRIVRPDGAVRWIRNCVFPIKNEAGKLILLTFFVENITERKHAEKVLRESVERYYSLFENSLDGIYISTPEGRLIDANPALLEMLGYKDKEELLSIYTPKDLYISESDRPSPAERNRLFSTRFKRKDNTEIWVEMNSRVIFDRKGDAIFYENIVRDITERKRAEEELRRSKEVLENITQGITDSIMLLSKDLKVLWANKTAMEECVSEAGEILGNYCYKVTHHIEDPCEPPLDPCPIYELQKTGKPVTLTHTHFDKEGNKIFVEVSAYPIKDEKGEVVQFIHMSKNTTYRMLPH